MSSVTPTERVASVRAALEQHPMVAWVTRAQSGTIRIGRRCIRMCDPGTPDLLFFTRTGRFGWFEVKSDAKAVKQGSGTESTRVAQLQFRGIAEQCNTIGGVVCSAEEAVAILEAAHARP